MKRVEFIRKTLTGIGAAAMAPAVISTSAAEAKPPLAGFNHLPAQKPETMSNAVIHRASTRGHANHGWLNSHHTFSFSQYYNPERMNFGVLRVLNDDTIDGGTGFGTHPHQNMEIISIPLEGDIEHKDSMGNVQIIRKGEIQVLSAGTGITHSEYNHNTEKSAQFLQIWVVPNKSNVQPRYDQQIIPLIERRNELVQIVSPSADDDGVWIHQNAWFSRGNFDSGKAIEYSVHDKSNGVYIFIIDGEIEVNGNSLAKRDGIGIWDTSSISIKTNSKSDILLMEVPMSM
jgi:redox-sensitive bicupin YhaK (pirin superfamily)